MGRDRARRHERVARHRVRLCAGRREAVAGLLLGRERRDNHDRARRGDARGRTRAPVMGAACIVGSIAPRLESRCFQDIAVFRRRVGASRHRHADDEPSWRPLARDAVDDGDVRGRGRGRLRTPSSERFRERVARVSRSARCRGKQGTVGVGRHAGHHHARDGRGARPRELHQGGRHDFSWLAAHTSSRQRA